MMRDNTNRGSRAAYILTVICLVLCLSFFTMAVSASDSQVYDLAGLFSSEEADQLAQTVQALQNKHKMNFAVLTTEDAEGKSAEAYADDFYDEHIYPEGLKKGGVLLLIDMDNREYYVSTAGDMIYYLTDAYIEDVLNQGESSMRRGAYADAVRSMLARIDQIVDKGLDGSRYQVDRDTGKVTRYRSITRFEALLALGASLLIALLACLGVKSSYSNIHDYRYDVSKNADMHLHRNNDLLINHYETRRRIHRNSSSGGGHGHGGRSTTHHSSGGHSHGGGGRRF
ncbi:MAG: TPM domain-containing protein [Eubacteriales bacterium]|nr:TPM domain-containing protein [Eubacteriales bacterium]